MNRTRVGREGHLGDDRVPSEINEGQYSNPLVYAWEPRAHTTSQQSFVSHELGNIFKRLSNRTTWITALKMQAVVVRNAAESIACAWIPNALYALGNIFSGKWYTNQSRSELLVANTVYASITFCSIVFISFLPMMLSLKFTVLFESRPTIWFCVKRLMRATWAIFMITLLLMFGVSCLIAYLTSIAPWLFKLKLECCADNVFLVGYFTGITRAVKQIYYEETQQGGERLQLKQRKSRKSKIVPGDSANVAFHAQRGPFKAAPRYHTTTFWRAYLRGLPMSLIPFVAGLFVHVLSQQRIADQGNTVLTSFVVAGIVFKLTIQEFAKHYVFKKRVRSARVMCVLVGIPTVLIDTQTRIILLGINSTQTAVAGAIGMALVEISLRAGKAVLVMWEIRHHKNMHTRRTNSILHQTAASDMFIHRSNRAIVQQATHEQRPSLSTGLADFEIWRRQVQAFHTSELNADIQSSDTETAVEANTIAWRLSQLKILGLQIAVEIVVDYMSIVLEMVIGIEFDHVKNLGSFLAALFMIAAIMNITISIGYYLS
ncbi:unnamed protein product [Phytophthora lilii]|uniref:Unnamed protein product n=1 Tax=Phytophthora lilii TaxID=2077276 RepID=A0A9W6U068_9STRA|nr:unnamed protein product [Phytophthora lilii]